MRALVLAAVLVTPVAAVEPISAQTGVGYMTAKQKNVVQDEHNCQYLLESWLDAQYWYNRGAYQDADKETMHQRALLAGNALRRYTDNCE